MSLFWQFWGRKKRSTYGLNLSTCVEYFYNLPNLSKPYILYGIKGYFI